MQLHLIEINTRIETADHNRPELSTASIGSQTEYSFHARKMITQTCSRW